MTLSDSISSLVDELEGEDPEISIGVSADSYAVLYASTDKEVGLNERQCKYLFNTVASAEQFIETIEDAEECSLELHDITISDEVLDVLEKGLLTVEEV